MNANLTLNAILTTVALTCSSAFSQSSPEFVQWNTIEAAPAGTILPDGSTARLTQTADFANANPGKVFSVGVFKVGNMHRVALESLTHAGHATEEVTFSIGWYILWDYVHFHTHQVYGDQSTCRFHWAPTYDSSGNIKSGEIELFAVVNPQVTITKFRVHYYGNASNWSAPVTRTEIDPNQLPLTAVEASQANYAYNQGNYVSFNGDEIYANGSPVLTQATIPGFLTTAGYLNQSSAATYLNTNGYLKKATGTNAVVSGGGILSLGTNSAASGNHALVLGGYNSSASGAYSMALGGYTTASDFSSVAIGSYSIASGSLDGNNIALMGGLAWGSNSFASTYGIADGEISLAMSGAAASGDGSVAIGGLDQTQGNYPGNMASGENASAIGGIGNVASGLSSWASGYWTKAQASHSVAIGSMNLAPSGNSTSWVETDVLFELGNGIAPRGFFEPEDGYSNAITTLKNGRTTLTNKAWSAAVAIDAEAALDDPAPSTDSGGEALVVDGHTRLRGRVVIEQPQGDIPMFSGN